MHHTTIDTPIGPLLATADEEDRITGLWFDREPAPASSRADDAFDALRDQLAAYFAGDLRAFDVPLALDGTAWQRTVWARVREIPYGTTVSYSEVAGEVCTPAAARAVGAANGRNPISILVPCHRVVGNRGALTGYAGGLDRKEWLLAHETSRLRA
jgi:methylated-DNA-[protein]-cysteine S-methyltransferase